MSRLAAPASTAPVLHIMAPAVASAYLPAATENTEFWLTGTVRGRGGLEDICTPSI